MVEAFFNRALITEFVNPVFFGVQETPLSEDVNIPDPLIPAHTSVPEAITAVTLEFGIPPEAWLHATPESADIHTPEAVPA
jgi:hypothetical protein